MYRVLYVTNDSVGPRMAGPGIRGVELATVLAEESEVLLAAPALSDGLALGAVRGLSFTDYTSDELRAAIDWAQVLVCDMWSLDAVSAAIPAHLPVVVDLYDLTLFEDLARWSRTGSEEQLRVIDLGATVFARALARGDLFLAGTERQRDYLLGALAVSGRLNAHNYAHDPTFGSLVAVVPYGCPDATEAEAERPAEPLQESDGSAIPGVEAGDKLVIWGGGLWEWLDPFSAIRAMAMLAERRPDVKLLFPGAVSTNGEGAASPVTQEAIALATSLGLAGQTVLFGEWLPYAERRRYLLRADVGLSLHLDTAEARMASVRSRVVDYIWAGLPMVLADGDVAADLVRRHRLGRVVACGDVEGVAEAVIEVADAPRSLYADRLAQVRSRFVWRQVAQPLARFCEHPRLAPDRATAEVATAPNPADGSGFSAESDGSRAATGRVWQRLRSALGRR